MAKLKIFTFPDLVLAQKAAPIQRVDKSMFKTADDMLETMYGAPGIGLAANQVGLLQRMIVIDTEYDLEELEEGQVPDSNAGGEVIGGNLITGKKPKIIFNPEIIYKEGKASIAEGCLSVPEFTAEVPRAEKIKVRYQDIDGLTREMSADGLLAICIQHELDHLDGRLFIDRLTPLKKQMVKKRLKEERLLREEEDLMEAHFKKPAGPRSPGKKKQKGF